MQRLNILDHLSQNLLTVTDFDQRDDFTNNIVLNMTEDNLISKGAVGEIYSINDQYVVKQIKPCDKKNAALQRYCVDIYKLFEYDIIGIAGGNNQYRYILPNLISEITVGLILGDLDICYANTISSMILTENEELYIYIIMNKLNPLVIKNKLTIEMNHIQFMCMLFQLSQGLLAAQQEYKLTHYDLHLENLLYDNFPSDKSFISYPLPNQNMKMMLMKEYCPYIFKIADFALSRIEVFNAILAPSIDDYPLRTYGEFNQSYDFACLLGSILIETKHKSVFKDLFDDIVSYKWIIGLTLWFYKEEIDITYVGKNKLDELREYISNKYYKSFGKKYSFRPKQEEDFVPYMNTQSMVDVVNYIAKYLITTKYVKVHQNNANVMILKDLGLYKSYDPVLLYNTLNRPMQIMDNVYVYKKKLIIKSEPKDYNYTLEKKQIDNCPYQEQYMTVVVVDKPDGQFYFDCCKLDAPNYLVQNNQIGFVINGGFFSIKKDYLPIGPYKDKYNTINKYSIPDAYKDVYGHIMIKNNKLIISKILDKNAHYCSSGPLLIENGKIVIDIKEKRYHCSEKKYAGDFFIAETEDTITLSGYNHYEDCNIIKKNKKQTIKRCDKILPGELSHASNPNPRSILCITPNGYIFIVFDGRSLYGDGVDLYEASQIILKKYPNVISAINLDGGRSSVMAWRSMNEPNVVYNNSNFRNYYYPAGYVIGLKK